MNYEKTIEQLSKVVLTIPQHWPDAEEAKKPQRVLKIDSCYVVSKNHYKLKVTFAVGHREISGTGTTLFEAAQDTFKKAINGYGASSFSNHECFL